MAALVGTSSGYTAASALDPSIDTVEWASLQAAFGKEYFVQHDTAARVTLLSGTTFRIGTGASPSAPQIIGGGGVVDVLTGPTSVTPPTPGTNGTLYYPIYARRTWQATNATSFEYGASQTTPVFPTSRNTNPGVIDDQPLALVSITKNGTTITAAVVEDLRCIGYGGGYYLINSTMVMDYMSRPGYRFRTAGGDEWVILLNGSRRLLSSEIVTSSGIGTIGTYADGWNDAPGTCYMLRDGRHRSMFLELRRQSGTIAVGASGHVDDEIVRKLDAGDKPAFMVVASGLYKNSGDYGCTLTVTPAGDVKLNHATPSVNIPYTPPGDWTLRVFAEWYTS